MGSVVSKGRSPRGPLSSFLNSSNSCCCSCCHKKMASLDKSFLIFSNEFDILGKKLRKELAMPRKEWTSLTLVGGARSMIAWHFSLAGLYPFSPPRVKPAKFTVSPNWTVLLEIFMLYFLHLSNSFSDFLRTSSSLLPSNNKSSTSDSTSKSARSRERLFTK